MAVNKADSSVNFSITISTRKGKQLSHCCRDIFSWRSNCGLHQRSSIGCRSWNMQQNSCFGGAPTLHRHMHRKGKTAPRFHHAHPNTLYFHCILTFSCNLRVWRRTHPASARAMVFDVILIVFLFYHTLQTLIRDVTSK